MRAKNPAVKEDGSKLNCLDGWADTGGSGWRVASISNVSSGVRCSSAGFEDVSSWCKSTARGFDDFSIWFRGSTRGFTSTALDSVFPPIVCHNSGAVLLRARALSPTGCRRSFPGGAAAPSWFALPLPAQDHDSPAACVAVAGERAASSAGQRPTLRSGCRSVMLLCSESKKTQFFSFPMFSVHRIAL